jgi:hypothetical protein
MHGVIAMGRKRQMGNREPNGQLQRKPEKPVDTKKVAATMPHRRGVPAQHQDEAAAESNFGRLMLNGKLTRQQYGAGIRYRDIVLRFRAIMSIPPHTPPSMAGIIVGAWQGGRMLSMEEVGERRSNYSAATEALESGAGNRGMRTVNHVTVYEREHYDLRVLQCGLNVLIRHFELTDMAKSAHVRNIQ